MSTGTKKAPKLPTPIDKFAEVVNQGNTDAFLALFSAAGSVDDWRRRFNGQDAIRRWSDNEFIGAKGQLTVKKAENTSNGARLIADWTSKVYTGPSAFEFVLDGELIEEMRITAA